MDKFVVCLHGFGSHKASDKTLALTREMQKRNIGVVTFDLPMHGENKTPLTLKNCLAQLDEVVKKTRVSGKPIGLYGSSFGAYLALLYLIENPNERFDGVLLVMPAVNMHEVIAPSAGFKRWGIPVSHDFVDELSKNQILPNAQKIKHRLNIIYGTKDIVVDNSKTLELARLCSATLFPMEAGHNADEGNIKEFTKIAKGIYA
jgi:alpha-beta hydrolase superfamily lysophospholipase